MKLAVNALIHGLGVALSESLALAERAGIDRTTAYEVFASGAAAAPFVLYKRAAYERPDETPIAFSLDLVGKDLDLILDLAAEVGASMRQAETNRAEVRTRSPPDWRSRPERARRPAQERRTAELNAPTRPVQPAAPGADG